MADIPTFPRTPYKFLRYGIFAFKIVVKTGIFAFTLLLSVMHNLPLKNMHKLDQYLTQKIRIAPFAWWLHGE